MGPLSGVVKDALLFSYELACEGTALKGSSLLIEDVPLLIHCPRCDAEKPTVSVQQLECVDCGSPATRVTQGDELQIAALELQA